MFRRIAPAVVAVLAIATVAQADGMIVPVRPDIRVRGEWAVKYHRVNIEVVNQVAEVSIEQAFINVGRADIEVEYMFPLPPNAGITSLTMVVDGKEMVGELLKADEARKIYEDIVRKKKDPALLEYVGYGLYKTSVFPLSPGKENKVIIKYTAPCRKDRGLVDVFYPLNTEKFSARPIEDVTVRVHIKAPSTIISVFSSSHEIKVEKQGNEATAVYKVEKAIPSTDFHLYYQSGEGDIGATVVSHKPKADADGYFMMMVSPNPKLARQAIQPKDVVFVIDHSGSMSGDKLSQAKESLQWIIKNLNEGDRFNVVPFSDTIETLFTKELVAADSEHVEKAVDMVSRMGADGGTNIAGAMELALALVPAKSARPMYIIFLTDGQPTVGERDDNKILQGVAKANSSGARLFCLGVGYDVNVRLIDKLSADNGGRSEYVKENEPLERKVSGLYAKIKNPVMTNLKLSVVGANIKDIYPRELGDLFDGDQLMVVGRYDKGGKCQFVLNGVFEGKEKAFEYASEMDSLSEDISAQYVERLWATRRVGWLMDQIALNGQNKELVDEIIRLSRDYGIMTPYTSFLADETTHLGKDGIAMNRDRVGRGIQAEAASGRLGQMNADTRQSLRQARPADMATSPPAPPARASGMSGPMGGGGGGVMMKGNLSGEAYDTGEKEVVGNITQIGNQTLYRRGNVWLAPNLAELDLKKDADKIQTIRQFSTEYFELATANKDWQNRILATQEGGTELLIELRGQVYRILPPE